VEEFLLGGGANGIAFVEGPRVSVALEGDIAVYFQGDTHRALSDEHESHAHEILAAYRDRSGGPASGSGDNDLGFLSGEFSVVVFDKLAGCVLAARDPNGAEPLFWGTADFGNSLLFSTDAALLDKQCADADAFPAGTVFCSKCGEITGELTVLNVVGDDARESDDDEALDFLVGDDSEPRGDSEEIREIREPSASPKPAPARASDESSGDRHVFVASFPGDAAA
jgi:asparagine synthetase B (glutamine-hydrolysing)